MITVNILTKNDICWQHLLPDSGQFIFVQRSINSCECLVSTSRPLCGCMQPPACLAPSGHVLTS